MKQINQNFPPPGPEGHLDHIRAWMRERKWRQWLVVTVLFLAGWTLLFGSWIGIAVLRGSTDKNAGAVAANIVLMTFMGTVLFIMMHRASYRWFWHLDRKRASGQYDPSDKSHRFGAGPTDPPPRIRWPWGLRLRHLLLHALGMAALLYVFLPYENQMAIARFIMRHSSGRASTGSLTTLLFAWMPLVFLAILSMLLLSRQTRRRDAGLLDEEEKLLLSAETNWLFAYATAFTMTMLMCHLFGAMIIRHL